MTIFGTQQVRALKNTIEVIFINVSAKDLTWCKILSSN